MALGGEGDPFAIGEAQETATPEFEQIRLQIQEFNEWFRRWTGGRSDPRLYIFMTLVLGAMIQLARGEVMAPAATLLWYAGEALRVWGLPLPHDKGAEEIDGT